jgi:uncharacterized membrane protein
MGLPPDVVAAIVGMALASYGCRAGGFWVMGFVRLTPRVRAWLEAIPIAVLGAILAPEVSRGSPPEVAGFLAALLTMWWSGNDFVGAISGVAAVALLRGLLDRP